MGIKGKESKNNPQKKMERLIYHYFYYLKNLLSDHEFELWHLEGKSTLSNVKPFYRGKYLQLEPWKSRSSTLNFATGSPKESFGDFLAKLMAPDVVPIYDISQKKPNPKSPRLAWSKA